MRRKIKVKLSVKKRRRLFIVLLLSLCLLLSLFFALYFYYFQKSPPQNSGENIIPTKEVAQAIKKPIFIISESEEVDFSWKTYTFDPKVDINQEIFKTYPSFRIPPFTFKYPPQFKLKKVNSYITDNNDVINQTALLKGTKSVKLGYEISLEDSVVKCEYLLDGACPSINMAFSFYTAPEDVSYFDKIQDVRINAIPATLAFSYGISHNYPITSLFTLSPTVVMKVEVLEMCNTDSCRAETKQINAILSTIKNSDIPDINYVKRDFSVNDTFFEKEKFPVSLTSIQDYKLLQFYCSKEYISSGDSEIYTYYNLSSQKETALTDSKLLSYLKKITEKYNNSESAIKHFFPSIQYCDIEDGRTLFFYKLGPCGGGCGGIQHIALMSETGDDQFDNEISANSEDVPYFGCRLLAMVKPTFISQQYESYLLCKGEGYASIENVDLNTNVNSMIKRCRYETMESNAQYRCWEKDSVDNK